MCDYPNGMIYLDTDTLIQVTNLIESYGEIGKEVDDAFSTKQKFPTKVQKKLNTSICANNKPKQLKRFALNKRQTRSVSK